MRGKKLLLGLVVGLLCLGMFLLHRSRSVAPEESTAPTADVVQTQHAATPAPTENAEKEDVLPAETETPQETETPPETETPAETEHVHTFDGESGICLVCGYVCPHERHDAETAVCLQCGLLRYHHFGGDGVCDGCEAEASLYTENLPERFFSPAEHQGRIQHRTVTDENGVEHRLSVWLPWDYDANSRYNLVLLIHGDYGSPDDWMDNVVATSRGKVQMCWLYDHLTEERLCRPFIVASMDNAGMDDPFYGERLLEEILLPYLAKNYSTYASGASHEQLAAAREHIAIGGLSRGSIFTYSVGMDRCFDVAANFCCFSNGLQTTLADRLNSEEYGELPILCYVATVGTDDNPNYVSSHTRNYQLLCEGVERLQEGENARFFAIKGGHEFLVWYTSLYDALLLMF